MDLQPLDIKLIKTIYKHQSLTFSQLNKFKAFSDKSALIYQLNTLYNFGYVHFISDFGDSDCGYVPAPNSPVTLTDNGHNIVQTCKFTTHLNLKSFIIYQFVSFILAVTADNISSIIKLLQSIFS